MIVCLCVWIGVVFLSLPGCAVGLCFVFCVQLQCGPGCVLFLRHHVMVRVCCYCIDWCRCCFRVCRVVHVCSVLLFFLFLYRHVVWYSVGVVA